MSKRRQALFALLAIVALVVSVGVSALAGDDHDHPAPTRWACIEGRVLGIGPDYPQYETAYLLPEQVDCEHEGHDHAHDEEGHEDAPLGHGHTDGGHWAEAWYILTDPAHWIAEFAAELVFFFTIHFWIMERVIHKHRVSRRGNILHEEVSG